MHQIPCLQPHQIERELLIKVSSYKPQWMLVVAFGMILPSSFLSLAPCINLHTSLLPRWRGAAPIARAIENGDGKSGVSLMEMTAKLDAGNILCKKECSISKDDTAGSLLKKITPLAIDLLLDFWAQPHNFIAQPQDERQACYARKIDKAECQLDWRQDASLLERRIRAFNPTPGCFTFFGDERVKIWHALAEPSALQSPPGTLLSTKSGEIKVQCGQGILNIKELQFPGKKISHAHSLNRKFPSVLDSPA